MGESGDPRVQLVRTLTDAYNRGDWDGLRRGAHPDIEVQRPGGLGVTVGQDEVVERMAPEVMESQRFELHRIEMRGDIALAEGILHARGAGSGIEITQQQWTVYRFEGDLVRRMEIYHDREDALAAAWG